MNKRITSAALAALLSISALPVSACAAETNAPSLNREVHMQYMDGYPDGTFRPDRTVTRAEAAKLLQTLLAEAPAAGELRFSDVTADQWYADAVGTLTASSLLSGYPDGTFRPNEAITRAQFVTILARFPHTDIGTDQQFSDVPATHWASDAFATALAQGWISGYPDGTLRPDKAVTRAEAVTMLNRILGRQGDQIMAATGEGIRVMPDVPDTHWAYLAMLEATTDHEFTQTDGRESWTSFDRETTALAAGWHTIGGELFHVNTDGQFDRNTTIDGLTLDRNGRYTTGNETLDGLLTAAVQQAGVTDAMSDLERLRTVYDYAKRTFGYLGIGAVDTTVAGWDAQQATQMLQTQRGNCYSWAGVFTHLARKVGFDATAIAGTGVSPKGSESVHAWTEIVLDGVAYTFDPQIESVYAARYGEQYDLYMKRYGEAEWGYQAAEQQPEVPAEEPQADAALAQLMEQVYGTTGYPSALQQTVLYQGMGADGQSAELRHFLGTNDLPIETGLASEPMINVQAHSIVLARLAEGTDMEAAAALVRENADPYKWVCVGVDPSNVRVAVSGNVLLLIMDDDNADAYLQNFQTATKSA